MCLDLLNWALWARFHGRYLYQSFIDGSNIWCVHRTDPWGPEMDHPPLRRSFLVVVPSYDIMCLDPLNWALRARFHGRYWYQSFIDGSNILCVYRTDPWSAEMDHRPLDRTYLVVVPSYYMTCALIFLTGFHGLYFKADIDINPSAMGPILGVSIGPILGVPKWTICHWAAANW